MAVWVKSEAAKAGIDVTINEMPSAPFAASPTKKELAFFHYPHWGSLVNDPFFHYFWHFTDSCCNWGNYLNPEVVKLINDAPGRVRPEGPRGGLEEDPGDRHARRRMGAALPDRRHARDAQERQRDGPLPGRALPLLPHEQELVRGQVRGAGGGGASTASRRLRVV